MATKKEQMDALKVQIEQLRKEASVERKAVSVVAKELMAYCEEHKSSDILVTGITDSHNPFQEKKSCTVL